MCPEEFLRIDIEFEIEVLEVDRFLLYSARDDTIEVSLANQGKIEPLIAQTIA